MRALDEHGLSCRIGRYVLKPAPVR